MHATGSWPRFDRYEIRNGVIGRAAGSRLIPYDPAADFAQTARTIDQQPPYIELVRLLPKLPHPAIGERMPRSLSAESEIAILDWCGRHGLLGILLSRWESVTLAARRDKQNPDNRGQKTYHRAYGQIIVEREVNGTFEKPRPHVVIHDLDDLRLRVESLTTTWGRFFPSVSPADREAFAYPPPYSPEFWELYGEPLFDFYQAARQFTDMVWELGSAEIMHPGTAAADEQDILLARSQAVERLNLWRSNVSEVLTEDEREGGFRQDHEAPSLLASYTDMLARDLLAGQRAAHCESCDQAFITSAYQARYCSEACRVRQQKRNVRSHQKQARELYLGGRSIREIARNLGDDPDLVRGWVADLKRGRSTGSES